MAIPQGANAQYYLTGRGLALYQGAQPLAIDPPIGTPAWWQNDGIKDAVNGWPSKTGVEAARPGVQPTGGQYPPPNPGPVRIPWGTEYWSGYLWALQDPGTAAVRLSQNNWTSDYKAGLRDGLARSVPKDPRGFVPTAAQLAMLPAGIAALIGTGGGSPTPVVTRTPPAYQPPAGTTGGVYVPPPPLPPPAYPTSPVGVQATFEIYGSRRGRAVPMREALDFDGRLYHLKSGYQMLVGIRPTDGFGLGGRPGSWPTVYPSTSPANFGLDADKGVLEMDGRTPRGVAASDLLEIFGPNWRMQVYGAGTMPPAPPPMSPPIPAYPDGTLLKSAARPEVYLVELGQKRWIVDATVFQNRGYSYAQIQTIDQFALDAIPTGAPITA